MQVRQRQRHPEPRPRERSRRCGRERPHAKAAAGRATAPRTLPAMDLEPWLPAAARRRPDHPALILADGSTTTYADLHAQVLAVAGELAAAGVEAGDRVALALPAGVRFVATLHAALLLGAAVVPID